MVNTSGVEVTQGSGTDTASNGISVDMECVLRSCVEAINLANDVHPEVTDLVELEKTSDSSAGADVLFHRAVGVECLRGCWYSLTCCSTLTLGQGECSEGSGDCGNFAEHLSLFVVSFN